MLDELDWFCRNAYNLGLKNMSSWSPQHLARMFRCCHAIISEYPGDIGEQASSDLTLRGMFCNFMIASALLALARSENDLEAKLQHYLEMRKHINQFDARFEEHLNTLDEASRNDIRTKLATLLVFDFEGAIHLKS